MDWALVLFIFIIDAVLGLFSYWLGCRSVIPIEINNLELLKERSELELNISSLKDTYQWYIDNNKILENDSKIISEEIRHSQKEKELLDESNKQAQDFINQSEKLANEKAEAVYEKRCLELEHEYTMRKQDHQAIIDILIKKITEEKNELKSLQETRAAAIAAAQQEKHIQENKDYYCLILPIEEANDVNILRGVAKRISKPRSILMAIWQAYYQPIAKKKFPQILGKPDVCGVYKITNQETGECYIGQAIDVRRRWYDHCRCGIGIDTPQGNRLYAAMQEYGLDVFSFELLLECDSTQLNEKEKYFIDLYNSNVVGYNIIKGSNSGRI